MSCGAEIEAAGLLTTLTAGVTFVIPTIDLDDPIYNLPGTADSLLYQPVERPLISDVTSGTVGGTGAFDVIMAGVNAHLKVEYEKGRITGADYTKTYIELTQAAMASAIQFTLGRDQVFWQSQTAQLAAIAGRVALETAKANHVQMQFNALTTKANYALAQMKMATESAQYCNLQYQLSNILPAQWLLLKEQTEVQRAQTGDYRTDGMNVDGIARRQRELFEQQIDSYKKDATVKAARLFSDAWTVQKTIDEGLVAPNGFTNASLDTVLNKVKSENGF
jgi:hypothetical protein